MQKLSPGTAAGSATRRNLAQAISNEGATVQRYLCYAAQAREQADTQAAELFEEMARNEQQHARQFIRLLEGERSVTENLRAVARAENVEWKLTYPKFAAQAREEGDEAAARLFERIGAIENSHEQRFVAALLKRGGPQAREAKAERDVNDYSELPRYTCMFCGHGSQELLIECPVCQAVGAFEETSAMVV